MTETETWSAERLELQRVASHILARARFVATGRFGLRVTASGLATPEFGPDERVLRLAGPALVLERRGDDGARSSALALPGRSLRDVAAFAGVDLDGDFSCGAATPALGDVDAPLELGDAVAAILGWYAVAARALDRILPDTAEPSVLQLWPEHFDVAFDAATASGRVNLGASPGDAGEGRPYLYVGPWEPGRPGEPAYWNAPFGAVTTRDDLDGDPVDAAVAFYRRGLDLLG